MKIDEFDVFVIGSGIAGQTVAEACVASGLTVAMADNREFGGTCANRGCDPKKVLLAGTEILEMARHLEEKNVVSLPRLNWKKLQKFKKEFTKEVPTKTEEELSKLGVKLYHKSPHFLGKNTLSVEKKTVKADKIVIATGQVPRELPFEGAELLKTSDDFLNLKKLPKKIIFVGAGYVGMEFAHMAARAGTKVIVIDSEERPLAAFDADLVAELTDYSRRIGIDFVLKSDVTSVKKSKKKYLLKYKKKGELERIKAGLIINTAGRVPALAELELEKGKVVFDKKGVKVNSYLQSTSNENVYACGDVSNHSLPLTPLSGREGYVVSQNIMKENSKKVDVPVVPSVVFTLPNLASVGYLEKEAKERYKNVAVKKGSASDWFNAKRINAPLYSYKILINERTDEIVGAHLLGPHAAETINLFAMAINHGMTANDLQSTIFTYPTWGSDIKSMV